MKEVEDVLSKFKYYFTLYPDCAKNYKYECYVTNQELFPQENALFHIR
jgi:hypothetical protein